MPRHLTKKSTSRLTGIETECDEPRAPSLSSKLSVTVRFTVDWKFATEMRSTCDLKITMGYLCQG
jgi:hypothetical protein